MLPSSRARVGHSGVMFEVRRRAPRPRSRGWLRISETPKMPTAMPTKSMPLRSSLRPKVKRVACVKTSEPTRPNSTPTRAIAMPLSTEPCDRATVRMRPNKASAKYSGAPNATAIRASGGAKAASTKVAMQPAMNEPMADDRERDAGAALSRHLIAVDRGDGRRGLAGHVDENGGGRAAILSAVIDAGEHDERVRAASSCVVIGSSMAIVASGPMPGSTPISVPSSAADESTRREPIGVQRLAQPKDDAVEKYPCSPPDPRSLELHDELRRPDEELGRQADAVAEDGNAEDGHADNDQQTP